VTFAELLPLSIDALNIVALIAAIAIAAWVLLGDDDDGRRGGKGKMLVAALTALAMLQGLKLGGVASVCGLAGCGKTTIASQFADSSPAVVVIDPYAKRDRLNAARGLAERTTWEGDYVTFAELARDVRDSAADGTPSMLDVRPLRLIVQPSSLDPEVIGREASAVLAMCWHTGGGVTLICEEAALYSHKAAALVKQVATGGAHGGMRVVFISQRVGGIHPAARTQSGLLVQGPIVDALDAQALAERSPEFLARVKTLREGEHRLLWWRAGGEMGG
jgi:hypothetical protein